MYYSTSYFHEFPYMGSLSLTGLSLGPVPLSRQIGKDKDLRGLFKRKVLWNRQF